MRRNERRDETTLARAAVPVATMKSSGIRVITLIVIALLALIASLCPGVTVAEQRQLTPQESAQLYAHRIWDFSTEENTFSSILWLADVGGQGGWSGPVDLDAHRRIASQCHGEILAYLRPVPPGQLEGYAKGIANLMAHTDRVRMYPDRINMDQENAHPLWPCFSRAAGLASANGSAASAPPANIAPPRPNPPVAAASPTTSGNNGISPQANRMVQDAMRMAPAGWTVPEGHLPHRGNNSWFDMIDAERVAAAAQGAWIEQRLAEQCSKERTAAIYAARNGRQTTYEIYPSEMFFTQTALTGMDNGYGDMKKYRDYEAGRAKANPPSSELGAAAAYSVCLLDHRIAEIAAGDVPPVTRISGMDPYLAKPIDPKYKWVYRETGGVNQCLELITTGLYGGLKNNCDFPVMFAFCNKEPLKGSWAEYADCDAPKGALGMGIDMVAARGKVMLHTHQAKTTYWLACQWGQKPFDPDGPYNYSYQLGRGIIGTCRTYEQVPV